MKKHIIITKLFEFGGNNTHLKSLIKYFGSENIIFILEDEKQLAYLPNIGKAAAGIPAIIKPNLHKYANLGYPSTLSNIKDFALMLRSIFYILFISLKNGRAHITICAVEPEKHLYFLWLPFTRVTYILHSTAGAKFSGVTTSTCNNKLGRNKNIITVSEANKKAICKNWGIAPDKQRFVHVVYNCVIKDGPPGASKFGMKKNTKNVVTLGHVIDYKNPYVWLNVAKQVTQKQTGVTFTWVGNGPLLNDLKEAASPDKQIDFVGFKTNTADYLKGASVYYQPSLYETLCISAIEAMSHRLPCVASDAGGLPEVIEDKYNGFLVDPADVDAHVNAILRLLDDKDLSEQYGQNGYNRYHELFTYNSFKNKMDEIYAR